MSCNTSNLLVAADIGGRPNNQLWLDQQTLVLQNFGVALDESKNKQHIGQSGEIQAADSPVKVLVIPTDEELSIAQQTVEVINLSIERSNKQ